MQPRTASSVSPQGTSAVTTSPSINGSLATETDTQPPRPASPEGSSTTVGGQYLGPTSPYTFLRRAWQRFEEDGTYSKSFQSTSDEPNQGGSIFDFGDRQTGETQVTGFRLPEHSVTSEFMDRYFEGSMPTYRFLHGPTVIGWLNTYHRFEHLGPDRVSLMPERQAIVLIVLAISFLFDMDSRGMLINADEGRLRQSECLYQLARTKLRAEYGKPKLESIQARLACSFYLLHTRRPNQAWYIFGTAVQLSMALGLHRASSNRSVHHDFIHVESRKRTFWSLCTLDTYLSVVLGRPPLLRLEDIDQQYPEAIDDEDMTASGPVPNLQVKDTAVKASILHAGIGCIVKKATEQQYSVRPKTSQQLLDIAANLNKEAAAWKASLPIVMSGAVHPSSLIPLFRRQSTILQLAYDHALMLINRPSLLLDLNDNLRATQVEICLSAAKATLETLLAPNSGLSLLQTSWFMQYVTFNALSIVYVWLIQRSHNRIPALGPNFRDEDLFALASAMQRALTPVSRDNGPSLRYNIVLEELQQEARRLIEGTELRPPHVNGLIHDRSRVDGGSDGNDTATAAAMLQSMATHNNAAVPDMLNAEFPFDPDLWLQIDSFPFSDFGQPT